MAISRGWVSFQTPEIWETTWAWRTAASASQRRRIFTGETKREVAEKAEETAERDFSVGSPNHGEMPVISTGRAESKRGVAEAAERSAEKWRKGFLRRISESCGPAPAQFVTRIGMST